MCDGGHENSPSGKEGTILHGEKCIQLRLTPSTYANKMMRQHVSAKRQHVAVKRQHVAAKDMLLQRDNTLSQRETLCGRDNIQHVATKDMLLQRDNMLFERENT